MVDGHAPPQRLSEFPSSFLCLMLLLEVAVLERSEITRFDGYILDIHLRRNAYKNNSLANLRSKFIKIFKYFQGVKLLMLEIVHSFFHNQTG